MGDHSDHGYDYLKDFERRFELKARNPISVGWNDIDGLCKVTRQRRVRRSYRANGGREVNGSSSLGGRALKLGKTVVHYTLELADTVVASRYDSCITKIPLGQLHSFKEEIYEQVQDMEGTLIVKEYPTKSASTRSLRTHLKN